MRIILDECLSRLYQHKIECVYSPAIKVEHIIDTMPGAPDYEVLSHAELHDAVILTQDRKFSQLHDRVLYVKNKNLSQVLKKLEAMLW